MLQIGIRLAGLQAAAHEEGLHVQTLRSRHPQESAATAAALARASADLRASVLVGMLTKRHVASERGATRSGTSAGEGAVVAGWRTHLPNSLWKMLGLEGKQMLPSSHLSKLSAVSLKSAFSVIGARTQDLSDLSDVEKFGEKHLWGIRQAGRMVQEGAHGEVSFVKRSDGAIFSQER